LEENEAPIGALSVVCPNTETIAAMRNAIKTPEIPFKWLDFLFSGFYYKGGKILESQNYHDLRR